MKLNQNRVGMPILIPDKADTEQEALLQAENMEPHNDESFS